MILVSLLTISYWLIFISKPIAYLVLFYDSINFRTRDSHNTTFKLKLIAISLVKQMIDRSFIEFPVN